MNTGSNYTVRSAKKKSESHNFLTSKHESKISNSADREITDNMSRVTSRWDFRRRPAPSFLPLPYAFAALRNAPFKRFLNLAVIMTAFGACSTTVSPSLRILSIFRISSLHSPPHTFDYYFRQPGVSIPISQNLPSNSC